MIDVKADTKQYDDFNNGGLTVVRDDGEFDLVNSWNDIVPDRLKLNKLGEKMYAIMDLQEISKLDIEKVIKPIKY